MRDLQPGPTHGGRDSASELPLTVVARFGNVAEAGYFSEALEAEGIATTIRVEEGYDAITGAWNPRYVMFVAEDEAAEAAERLHEHVDRTEPRRRESRRVAAEAPSSPRSYESPDTGGSGLGPLVVVLGCTLLGLLLYGARQWGNAPAVAAAPVAAEAPAVAPADARRPLWGVIADEPGVWVRRDADGRLHEIAVDAEGNVEHRIDTDGDGRTDEHTTVDRP